MVCILYKLLGTFFPLPYGFGMVYISLVYKVRAPSVFPDYMLAFTISPAQFNMVSEAMVRSKIKNGRSEKNGVPTLLDYFYVRP